MLEYPHLMENEPHSKAAAVYVGGSGGMGRLSKGFSYPFSSFLSFPRLILYFLFSIFLNLTFPFLTLYNHEHLDRLIQNLCLYLSRSAPPL